MVPFPSEIDCGTVRTAAFAWQVRRNGSEWLRHRWSHHREASLNWLALGVLLAAWNASDSDTATDLRHRPEALRGYASVSVRAAATIL